MNILCTFKHYILTNFSSDHASDLIDLRSSDNNDTPLHIDIEPPPPQRKIIPFEYLDTTHSLRGAKGTLVTMVPHKVTELFPNVSNTITGPGPKGLYCVLISEFNDIKKGDILEALKNGIILQYSIDVYEIVH